MVEDNERVPIYGKGIELPLFRAYEGYIVYNVQNSQWISVKADHHRIKRERMKHVVQVHFKKEVLEDLTKSSGFRFNPSRRMLNLGTGRWSGDYGVLSTDENQILNDYGVKRVRECYDSLSPELKEKYPLEALERRLFPHHFDEPSHIKHKKRR
ncbi:hypothetical protein HYW74_00915 [Candidatus Pacearchaeota archaeon]|nr:hypothetical protein [Candidatus Pacearchaeota archaeon]